VRTVFRPARCQAPRSTRPPMDRRLVSGCIYLRAHCRVDPGSAPISNVPSPMWRCDTSVWSEGPQANAALWQGCYKILQLILAPQLHRLWAARSHEPFDTAAYAAGPIAAYLRAAVNPYVGCRRVRRKISCPFCPTSAHSRGAGTPILFSGWAGVSPGSKSRAQGIWLDVDPHTKLSKSADLFIYVQAHAKLMQQKAPVQAAIPPLRTGYRWSRDSPLSTKGVMFVLRTNVLLSTAENHWNVARN